MAIFNKQERYTREQLLDHYPKKVSTLSLVLKYVYGIARLLCIIVQNLYCVSSYLALSWIVLLPINWLRSDLYSRLENYLYNSLLFIVSSWSLAAGITVVESGDEYKHLIETPEKYKPGEELDQQQQLKSKLAQKQKSMKDCNPSRLMEAGNGSNYNPTHKATNSSTTKVTDRAVGLSGFSTVDKIDASCPSLSNGDLASTKLDRISSSSKITNGDCEHHNYENNNSESKALAHRTLNGGKGDSNSRDTSSASDDELPAVIEYQVELASAAGERKLVNGSYKTNFNSENSNALQQNTALNGTTNKRTAATILSKQATPTRLRNSSSHLEPPMALCSTTNDGATQIGGPLKNLPAKPRVLFLCNHISTADVPLIMQSFSSLTNQSLLWVLDAQFKPTNFGVVCSSHGDFFVAKNAFLDGQLREQVLKHPDRNLLVLFPEGGFLRKRIEGSNRYATKNGYPLTKYVTHPRFGAFKDLIDPSVGVTHIVDATMFYNDIRNPPSILDIVLGTKREPAILDYKLYKLSEINPTEQWLRNIWLEKDKALAKYYEGERSNLLRRFESTLRVASVDWFKLLAVHLFYLLVCYLAIFRLFNATSITMLKARELYYSNM